MTNLTMSPLLSRDPVAGAPDLMREPPAALLPALSMLRKAKTGADVIEAMNDTPEHLRFSVVDHVLGRHTFGMTTQREVLNYFGFPALVREFGHDRAVQMTARFV